jgi:cytochrome c biogenesis protein CcdA
MFFAALLALALVVGAAAHTSLLGFVFAAGAISFWLLAFATREGLTRLRRH